MSGVTPVDATNTVADELNAAVQTVMSSGLFNVMASQFQNAIGDISTAFSDDSSDPDAIN